MESLPLVSICIPTYNAKRFIAEAIKSVYSQNYPSFEILISDNASTDGSYELIKNLVHSQENVILNRNSANFGHLWNWNKVTSLASGKYIKLLCADDTILPNSLIKQVQFLESNPDHALVTGKRNIVNHDGKVILRSHGYNIGKRKEVSLDRTSAIELFLKTGTNPFGEPSAVLIRTTALHKLGSWHSNAGNLLDFNTYLGLLQYGKIGLLADTVSTFRVSKESCSYSMLNKHMNESLDLINSLASELNKKHTSIIVSKFNVVIKSLARTLIFRFS